ncbi:MAG: hypothetical protein IPO15_11475 [Anaerolineae bacterium]|uniref:hypothetical protein n=1 Tax=Candidatus Amarolinea dominans TaxID=3140696 RepID=UPI0031375D6E|nr:hypothetical protein [Anaerolineae bacterium]
MLPLTHADSQFILYVHQWPLRWYDRLIWALFGFGPMQPGEVEADFGPHFTIEKLVERRLSGYIAGEAAYLMAAKEDENTSAGKQSCSAQPALIFSFTVVVAPQRPMRWSGPPKAV